MSSIEFNLGIEFLVNFFISDLKSSILTESKFLKLIAEILSNILDFTLSLNRLY